ncbi:MAG: hypothetical protein O3A53_01780 [Acidobacteria bacterium]|nr:hypothetical protein [Acidobacteriota bacterium]MDA1233510.1 hypothetical protein [Acidobacteriota bacterium]
MRCLATILIFFAGTTLPLLAEDLILTGTVVTMTGRDAIIPQGAILIRDGQIQEIIAVAKRRGKTVMDFSSNVDDATVVETDGLIFPGLINIHNHTLYGSLPHVPIEQNYNNRYEWQPDDNAVDLTPFLGVNVPLPFNIGRADFNPYVEYPRHLLTNSQLFGLAIEASKYSEIKALVGGTTTIEGSINANGVTNMLIRNAESANLGAGAVFRTAQNITEPEFAPIAAQLAQAGQAGLLDAFLVHLAEGTDSTSLAELEKLKQLNLFDEWTVIVHGVPFPRSVFDEMAVVGADLVWSPTSNLALYGQTARADQALSAGVNVSLVL